MLGINLKKLRSNKKESQSTVAENLGISRSTYTKYETGDSKPDYEMLILLADYFDVSLDYLLGRTDDPNIAIKKIPSSGEDAILILSPGGDSSEFDIDDLAAKAEEARKASVGVSMPQTEDELRKLIQEEFKKMMGGEEQA